MMVRLLAILLTVLPQLLPVPARMQVRGGSFKVDGEKRMEWVLDTACNLPAEGYVLDVSRSRVRVTASTEAGLFYARQTLGQLEENGRIPCCRITDYPRFSWRGFHVDPCRHFLSTEEIKKQIDAKHRASRFKFKTLPVYNNGLPMVIEDETDYYK